jgi:hypothetical protein
VKVILLAALLVCAGARSLQAQAVAFNHVIPQVADGGNYVMLFFINRASASATINCTLNLRGSITNSRLFETNITMTSSNSSYVTNTNGVGQLATGFAVISCTGGLVTVNATYMYLQPGGGVRSAATVFSQNSFTRGQFQTIHDAPDIRLGIAIANNTSSTLSYNVTAAVDGNLIGKQFTLAPFTSSSQFLDEMLAIPFGFKAVVVEVTSSAPVNAIGFMFFDDVFTTVPVTIYN